MSIVLGWMPQASAQGPRDAAPTPAQGHANHTPPSATPDPAAPEVTLSGYIVAIHGIPEVEGAPMAMEVTLTDEQGVTTDLDMDYVTAYGLAGDGKRVTLKGKRVAQRGAGRGRERVQVTEVVAVNGKAPANPHAPDAAAPEAEAAPQAAVIGSVPWVTVLCRFSDNTGVTPRPVSYFEGLMGNTYPGVNHFWRQMSYGQANIDGSVVRGWYNMAHPRSYFHNSDGSIKHKLLLEECGKAAESSVYFPSFAGINFMFNDTIGCCAWGVKGEYFTFDGQNKAYSITANPPWAFNNQHVLAHEMGHGFGLGHSNAPPGYPGFPYNNWWDVLSGNGCLVQNATYGCVGKGTIGFARDWLGWIPAARKYTAPLGTVRAGITLERLDQPVSTSNRLLVRIPIRGSSTRFYTVEARQKAGYDAALPGAGVIIHEIDMNRQGADWAMVVDTNADGNSNTGDGSAIWSVGETFVDAANGIRVEVTGAPTTSSYRVVISNGTNLALNKPITGASGLCRESQPLTKAVDGTTANDSKWCSYSYGANRWLRIDLGASRSVRAVVIRHAGAGGESTGFNTRDFFIQGSADGSAWTTLATVTGNTASVTRTAVSANARYIRVEITNPSNNGDTATRLYEVEVYGY